MISYLAHMLLWCSLPFVWTGGLSVVLIQVDKRAHPELHERAR